jgi:preprotein translocase subunit SecG
VNRLTAIISAVLVCLIVCLGWLAMHYHNAASQQQTRAETADSRLTPLSQ